MPLLAESRPSQSSPEQLTSQDMYEAVRWLARCGLLAYYNETVLAVVGNANDPDLAPKLHALKKDKARSTVALTLPFRDILPMADTDAIDDPKLRRLLRDERDELSGRYAGIGFVRFPAKQEVVDNPLIPQILVGRDRRTGRPTMQGYSPTGADKASRLLRAARAYRPDLEQGELPILPVMTSANVHGRAEITTPKDARKFVSRAQRWRDVPIMALDLGRKPTPDTRPLGSYPIVTVRIDEQGKSRFERSREGCFDGDIIESLFDGYELDMLPTDFKGSAYPCNKFDTNDILEPYRKLSGPYKRLGLLATMGWQSDAEAMLDYRLENDR